MSQTFTDDWYAQSYNAATAFGQAEANDVALKSNFSGASAPSNAVAGMHWYHSTKGLRVRNAANGAWLKVLQGDASSKMWFYRNDAAEGWIVDTSVTDRVLAIKGGTAAYNVTGGSAAGSHTISGLSAAEEAAHTHAGPGHSHKWYDFVTGSSDRSGDTMLFSLNDIGAKNKLTVSNSEDDYGPGQDLSTSTDGTSNTGAGSSHGHAISHDGSSRPAAAVGTLQYPDLS